MTRFVHPAAEDITLAGVLGGGALPGHGEVYAVTSFPGLAGGGADPHGETGRGESQQRALGGCEPSLSRVAEIHHEVSAVKRELSPMR